LPRFLLSLDVANYVIARTATGDVILSRKPESWQDFFELLTTADVPDDFLADRKDMPQTRF
jgi:antitoxin VapB